MTTDPCTSDLPDDWISALLDDELPDSLRASAESRLASSHEDRECFSALQELDRELRSVLQAPEFDPSAFLAALPTAAKSRTAKHDVPVLQRMPQAPVADARHGRRRLPAILSLSLLAALGLTLILQSTGGRGVGSADTSAVVAVSLGRVELRCSETGQWRPTGTVGEQLLTDGCHLRTGEDGLCEVQLASGSLVRLKQQSEILVRSDRELQLLAGSVWCRAAAAASLTMVVPVSAPAPAVDQPAEVPLSVFSCPSESRTQWQVTRQGTTCQSVSDQELQLQSSPDIQCTVQPGERMLMDQAPEPSGTGDPLLDTSWQLPLLITRPPRDPELQSVLQQLLSQLGRTKLAGMYDQQIRALGPAGTLPLIALVRSTDPDADRELRHRAMEIIADLAPRSAVADLEILAKDSDPHVRHLAIRALIRFC